MFEDLFCDTDQGCTMFRVVVKSNLTRSLAEDLTDKLVKVLSVLDEMDSGYESLRSKVACASNKQKGEVDVPIVAAPSSSN